MEVLFFLVIKARLSSRATTFEWGRRKGIEKVAAYCPDMGLEQLRVHRCSRTATAEITNMIPFSLMFNSEFYRKKVHELLVLLG